MTVKLFACGDIVNVQKSSGLICSESLANVIRSADYAVCNFEAPIEGIGSPIVKSGPHIQQKVSTLKGLKDQGFDLALLANNHMMDFGAQAMQKTKEKAIEIGLDVVGAGLDFAEAYKPLVKEINGLKFGIINACEAQFGVLDYFQDKSTPGYAWINHNQIDKTILKLKEECDFILVFSHAGLENYDIPQKEWRERYKHLCDLGVDVVIGAHPHVPQGYEEHNGSLVFYSLGNFYFDWGRHASNEDSSYAVMLEFEKNKNVTFTPVFHVTDVENLQVTLAEPEKTVDLEELAEKLNTNYQTLHDEMTLKAYQGVKTNLLRALSPIPQGRNLKSTVKEFIATLLGRRRSLDKPTLSLHLLRNEAYYFAARNALELKQKERLGK